MRNWCNWFTQTVRNHGLCSWSSNEEFTYPENNLLVDAEEDARKKTTWYQWIVYDIRCRILFGTLLAIFVGVGIPLIIYFIHNPGDPDQIYGSCYLKQEYRVKCLVNQYKEPTEDECIAAKCCWTNNNTIPFKCFHSLAPAYQYYVSNVDTQSEPGAISLDIVPNLIDRMSDLKVLLKWKSTNHLNVQIYNPTTYNPASSVENLNQDETEESFNTNLIEDVQQNSAAAVPTAAAELDSTEFKLNYATIGEFFHLNITRNFTQELIFDTRLGPLIGSDDGFISFVTALPTPYFYGVQGGISGSGNIYDNFNKYGLSDFPLYLALESSGNVHGVFIETNYPFSTQVLGAPGLMFHLQGPEVVLNLHFFVGPTVKLVYQQLYSYLKAKHENSSLQPKMHLPPPYWALGLHLCRTALDERDALVHMQNLTRLNITYDSDCIDENLRIPFEIDPGRYPNNLTDITNHLRQQNQNILLVQKIGLPILTTNMTSTDSLLIMKSEDEPLIGFIDSIQNDENSIYYLDFISPNSTEWVQNQFDDKLIMNDLFNGLVIIENYPLTYNATGTCKNTKTRLEHNFIATTVDTVNKGLICPESIHPSSAVELEDEEISTTRTHFEVHNIYGHESLIKLLHGFKLKVDPLEEKRLVFTSSSIWTTSFITAGFNGPEVPFSWNGMIESLDYILRNFMFLQFSGTPICGSYLEETNEEDDTDELCFRWFQLGLLLPFARNSYRTNGPKGLLDLKSAYRERIKQNIQERYKYNPYYYTLYYEYAIANLPEPIIRPILYDFPEATSNTTFRIMTQFMIGEALMSAPILTKYSSQREAYFPPGIWFNSAGRLQWSNEDEGGILIVEGSPNELPIYLRSGYVIPILEEEVLQGNAMKTREGNYAIVGTFPSEALRESKGNFFYDDGFEVNSIGKNNFDLLNFTITNCTFEIMAECGLQQNPPIPKIINQIKVFNFPVDPVEITMITDQMHDKLDLKNRTSFDEEYEVLYLRDLKLLWCTEFNELTIDWCTVRNSNL